jgi:hypothetical protein
LNWLSWPREPPCGEIPNRANRDGKRTPPTSFDGLESSFSVALASEHLGEHHAVVATLLDADANTGEVGVQDVRPVARGVHQGGVGRLDGTVAGDVLAGGTVGDAVVFSTPGMGTGFMG